jgi:hypothetical protein
MTYAIVDFRTSKTELDSLNSLGFNTILCPPSSDLYEAVCGHPDMQIMPIAKNTLVINKKISNDFLTLLNLANIRFYKSKNNLIKIYPHDIILNSFILGDIFVHKLDYTDPVVLEFLKNKTLINVNQGYSKCSTAIINSKSIITSDVSILRALENHNIDILYVPPGDIELPGLNYGFIGGSCGLLREGYIGFFGELDCYKYGREVKAFLKKHNVVPIYLKKGPLTDRGTLFTF